MSRRNVVKIEPPSPQLGLFGGAPLPAAPRTIAPPALVTPKPAGLTFTRALEDYRAEHMVSDGADHDRLRRFGYVQKALLGFFDGRVVESLVFNDGRLYTAKRGADGVMPATAGRELTFLIAACNHAKKEGRTKHEIKLWKPKPGQPRVETISPEDEARLMAVPKPRRIQLLMHLGFNTGARARAMEQLTWDRVDLERRTIDYRLPGIDHKNKRRAVVPIRKALHAVLVEAKVWRDEHEPNVAEVIGLGVRGACSTTYHDVADVFAAIGLKVRAPRHVMRHTFATRLLRARVPIARVAFLMGDTSAMVEKVYAHFIPSDMADDVEKL